MLRESQEADARLFVQTQGSDQASCLSSCRIGRARSRHQRV